PLKLIPSLKAMESIQLKLKRPIRTHNSVRPWPSHGQSILQCARALAGPGHLYPAALDSCARSCLEMNFNPQSIEACVCKQDIVNCQVAWFEAMTCEIAMG
ncbi:MAG: hypothetical protein D6814_02675, partial [Calditrichaeota bacterium]